MRLCNDFTGTAAQALTPLSCLPSPPPRRLPWTVTALTGREDLGDGATTAYE